MTEHTQEQWHVDGWKVVDANGDIVANEIDSRTSLNLIAAAPDLLVAAERALDLIAMYGYGDDSGAIELLEDAIAKAGGEWGS